MKIRFSISLKLLVFILPLVCLPIIIVGYFSTRASVERVNRLVHHELTVEVETTAKTIDDVFKYCRLDLEIISSLPVLEDYHAARSFRLEAESEFNYDNIVRLFKDFISRTPYYRSIRYIDNLGIELIKVSKRDAVSDHEDQSNQEFFRAAKTLKPGGIFISDILRERSGEGFVIQWAKPIFSIWKEFSGVLVIDLDYDQILETINEIRVGERGYAFLIDQLGRIVAHPFYEIYKYNPGNYPNPTIEQLGSEMMGRVTGSMNYSLEGEDKVAAFAPILSLGWSMAVAIPSVELKKEAQAIKTKVIQVVLISLLFALAGVSILSYYLLRPVRNLVTATKRIANGDLSQDIPVQSRDELGDLTSSFNRMVRNLSRIQDELVRSEKLISLGRLSAGVAHEIRNPLNAMKGAIVYLQRRRSDDPLIKEYTHLVSEEIDRLSEFVTEFLYFARQAFPDLVRVDLNKLLLSTLSLFERQAEEKKIFFHSQTDPSLPLVLIDPKQIEQVFVNLIINSMDAMPDGGHLKARSRFLEPDELNPSGSVQVILEDNGLGISHEHLKNIFDPFFSTKENGTGLGLPLCLGILEAHGGRIDVSSEEGLGTNVIITLPLSSEEEIKENPIE
ncbi:MAG TPA: cache domain-containing protein [Desulfobacteraceae bacterium]|nr:cache domain-containing protein [Desulfobacteraceae bacterium]HPJ68048.1 cache domain-containing protein [Desulfobacteraceae bacterium]HPQ28389.1 cache domain-containing protein [Desulfobacteraceae bacterium]